MKSKLSDEFKKELKLLFKKWDVINCSYTGETVIKWNDGGFLYLKKKPEEVTFK